MGKGRSGWGILEGQNREKELSKKNWFLEKELSSIELERAVVCSWEVWFRLFSLCKPKGLKGIFGLSKMKYFQRLNWDFFTLLWRWGEIFCSKTYKFHQRCMKHGSCRQSFYLQNLSISLLCGFLFKCISLHIFSDNIWSVSDQGSCDKRELNCCDGFSTFLNTPQGTEDILITGTKVNLQMHQKGKRHKPGAYCPIVSTNKKAVHLKEWRMWIVGIWKCGKLRPDFSVLVFMGQI